MALFPLHPISSTAEQTSLIAVIYCSFPYLQSIFTVQTHICLVLLKCVHKNELRWFEERFSWLNSSCTGCQSDTELMTYTTYRFCKLPFWKQQFELGWGEQDRRVLSLSLCQLTPRAIASVAEQTSMALRATGKWLKFGSRMSKPLAFL